MGLFIPSHPSEPIAVGRGNRFGVVYSPTTSPPDCRRPYTIMVGAMARSYICPVTLESANDLASLVLVMALRARQSGWGCLFLHHQSARLPSPLHHYGRGNGTIIHWPGDTRISVGLASPMQTGNGCPYSFKSAKPYRRAMTAAWVRSETSSLVKIALT